MSGDEVVLGTLAQKNQTAEIKISFGHWHLGTESIVSTFKTSIAWVIPMPRMNV
jgi:hypothetical protein